MPEQAAQEHSPGANAEQGESSTPPQIPCDRRVSFPIPPIPVPTPCTPKTLVSAIFFSLEPTPITFLSATLHSAGVHMTRICHTISTDLGSSTLRTLDLALA